MKYTVKRIPTTNNWALYQNGCHLTTYPSKWYAMMNLCNRLKDYNGVSKWNNKFLEERKIRKAIAQIEMERGYGDGWYEVGI